MSILDAAGGLVVTDEKAVAGRIVATFEYGGYKQIPNTNAGQHELWKPKLQLKKDHLYWVVGSITSRWSNRSVANIVVSRPKTGVELQKFNFGGNRQAASESEKTYSVYINAMFTAETSGEEELSIICNTPNEPWATGTRGYWLYDNAAIAQIYHNIYVIDMGLATALVPDTGVSGQRLDNAGALAAVDGRPRAVAATVTRSNHVDIDGTAAGQTKILEMMWAKKPNHRYLVIVAFTAILLPDTNKTRDYWIYDPSRGTNPARTRIGTYNASASMSAEDCPVTMVMVTSGDKIEVHANRNDGDAEWLTEELPHFAIAIDLGPSA